MGLVVRTANFNNSAGRNTIKWVQLIEQDRNFARIIIGLPLNKPISALARRAALANGYTARRVGKGETLIPPTSRA